MDALVPHSWLKDFLETSATPRQIAEALSLCGPSVEKLEKQQKDFVYSIEVTTNRVDSAGVLGLAREAAAILPRFKKRAKLLPLKTKARQEFVSKVGYLEAKVDHNLCSRFTAILLKDIKIRPSPNWMQERLKLVGLRPINNVVDISNYIMHELGQPTHTFDYDKIGEAKMILRASKKGEKITTLDGKSHKLPGGDIIIEDGKGRIIDLAGVMGGENSEVESCTKNVLFFVQTYNPTNIRKTSMSLAQRTEAASLFEKGLDPEAVTLATRRGIDLFVQLCSAKPVGEILDLYPRRYQKKVVRTTHEFIETRLGVKISKEECSQILISLGFGAEWLAEKLPVEVPSFRACDISLPEDILEEIARIYGYHKLPSFLVRGLLPEKVVDAPFGFESKIKHLLKGWGGTEVYTLSLVSKEQTTSSWALKLKNPLGPDSEYLRLSLAPSLVQAVKDNSGQPPFHLFEMSNVYLPTRGKLPEEKMMLAGIFSDYKFEEAKGILEALFGALGIIVNFNPEDSRWFLPYKHLTIVSGKHELGHFGFLKEGFLYYELGIEALRKISNPVGSYTPIPKYPPQIEDISVILPPRTLVGNVIKTIERIDKQVVSVQLSDTYENTRTFRIEYQNLKKTLADKEVEKIREKIIRGLEKKFRARIK